MDERFNDIMSNERRRLAAEREQLVSQKATLTADIDAKIIGIDKELSAISAYEAAKNGKAASAGGGTRRARRGSRREELVSLIRDSGAGLSRGELLEKLGVKGDKSGEMSVSNALTALTKSGQLARDGRQYVFQHAA